MNKKIIVIVVIVECVLAILLVSVIGKAIENYYSEILADEIYFVNADGERYGEDAIIEVELTDTKRGYQLQHELISKKTSDKSVKYTSDNPDVEVSEDGYVTFFENTSVTITVSTKNGKAASIRLVPKRNSSGIVDII